MKTRVTDALKMFGEFLLEGFKAIFGATLIGVVIYLSTISLWFLVIFLIAIFTLAWNT